MGKALERKRQIFKKFSGQLLLLHANGLLDWQFKYPDPYICPICRREFSEDHLNEDKYSNFLTAEDAPPAALGGSKIALTCRECNNRCGQQIDWHLIEALRAIDASRFYKGSKQSAIIEFEGKKITVELEALGGGSLSAYHANKHNNPTLLEKFIFGIKNKTIGPVLNFRPPTRRFLQERINYALVKTNYILTFAKFGYLFLLDNMYQPIRDQLLHPENIIYPWTPFIKDQFKVGDKGTYYLLNENMEAILNVFVLKTEYSETVIGGFIQNPLVTMGHFGQDVDGLRDAQQVVQFDVSKYDPDANLFTNLTEMKRIIKWINKS